MNLASQIGRTFKLFDWTGVAPTGAFGISSPYTWNGSNLYTTGEITLTAVPEPSAIVIAVLGVVYVIRRPHQRFRACQLSGATYSYEKGQTS
jgi:hypothetical protein